MKELANSVYRNLIQILNRVFQVGVSYRASTRHIYKSANGGFPFFRRRSRATALASSQISASQLFLLSMFTRKYLA